MRELNKEEIDELAQGTELDRALAKVGWARLELAKAELRYNRLIQNAHGHTGGSCADDE